VAATNRSAIFIEHALAELQWDAGHVQERATGSGLRMKIVVGYDGSEPAKRALERAAALAGDQGRIVVVAVGVPSPRSGITIPANRDAEEIQTGRDDLSEARRHLLKRGVQAETVQARGNPAEVLIEASRDADLVIVGSRGLNRLERLVLGSVSSRVVHEAACDVLVVR
jgi:nucleotide-binding universal stress UspA family protein